METCGIAGRHGNLFVKQFVQKLKRNVFYQYIDLYHDFIDTWERLKKEFLNHFYRTRQTISMIKLTSTMQRNDKHLLDYINHCRKLTLECKDYFSIISDVEIRIQDIRWNKAINFYITYYTSICMELSIIRHK